MAQLLADARAEDPVLPGAWFIFEAERSASVPGSIGSTVLVPFTHDWGPDNEVVEIDYNSMFADKFGGSDTSGRRAVFGAFLGEGIPGRGGAGKVLGYRLSGAAGLRASRQLTNTAAANALLLTARYKGTRGNGISVTVRAGVEAGTNELVIIEGGREVEVYPHATTAIQALQDDINASGGRLTASGAVNGTALTAVAGVQLQNGHDGAALVAGDWTGMLDKLEYEPFSVLAAHELTDPAIITSLRSWKADLAKRGKRIFLVLGAALGDTFSAHKTRAAGYNDEDVFAFGTGNIGDSTLTVDGSEVVISTAQGVGRVAGAIARRGELFDMVNVRFAGWRAISGATRAQAEIAAKAGMSLLTRDGDRDAPTKIGLGVTSYFGDTTAKPFSIYSVVKFVRTMHGLEADITADQEGGGDELIDGRGITDKSRDLIRGRAKAVINDRMARGILQPGSAVDFDPDRPPTSTDAVVSLVYDAVFVRGLRGIRNRIRVG